MTATAPRPGASETFDARRAAPRVVGIDVGGSAKGFHAVLLAGAEIIEQRRERDPAALATWCVDRNPETIAIDAPSRWREPPPAKARSAERALAALGVACYYTPTEERARSHPFYAWMLPGAALFSALRPAYPLYPGGAFAGPCCVETFPHAVACALGGTIVSAKEKMRLRAGLLREAGIPVTGVETMDELDALLCALAASAFARGEFKAHGSPADGFIIIPRPRMAAVPA